MEKYKTIKELADELGFSKAYIDKTIRLLSMQTELVKIGNKYVIDEMQEILIRERLSSKKKHNETHTSMHTEFNTDSEILFLRKQLADRNTEFEHMRKLLDQQQQLTLQANKQIEKLQEQLFLIESSENEKKEEQETENKMEVTKKWYQFWK